VRAGRDADEIGVDALGDVGAVGAVGVAVGLAGGLVLAALDGVGFFLSLLDAGSCFCQGRPPWDRFLPL
jgi:hypothetical protein